MLCGGNRELRGSRSGFSSSRWSSKAKERGWPWPSEKANAKSWSLRGVVISSFLLLLLLHRLVNDFFLLPIVLFFFFFFRSPRLKPEPSPGGKQTGPRPWTALGLFLILLLISNGLRSKSGPGSGPEGHWPSSRLRTDHFNGLFLVILNRLNLGLGGFGVDKRALSPKPGQEVGSLLTPLLKPLPEGLDGVGPRGLGLLLGGLGHHLHRDQGDDWCRSLLGQNILKIDHSGFLEQFFDGDVLGADTLGLGLALQSQGAKNLPNGWDINQMITMSVTSE